jgi:hypothetical protein
MPLEDHNEWSNMDDCGFGEGEVIGASGKDGAKRGASGIGSILPTHSLEPVGNQAAKASRRYDRSFIIGNRRRGKSVGRRTHFGEPLRSARVAVDIW